MQSSIAIPRSQPVIVTMGVGLVAAALLGGAGGYALKSLTEVTVATQPARHAAGTVTFSVPAGIYVQGGRPWSVYDAIRNSSPSTPASTRHVQ
jgi:hypothetical protein